MSLQSLVLGVDFGTGGVRSVVVDTENAAVVSTGSATFPDWDTGRYCDPRKDIFRQHPRELTDAFCLAVTAALDEIPPGRRDSIAGLSVDTTGSSPTPIGDDGLPLAFSPVFQDNPAAMMILWKDHSAVVEAAALTEQLRRDYSSEWFWAKIIRVSRESDEVLRHAVTWAEQADWFPAMLCGNDVPTAWGRCLSGAAHKALWTPEEGYPSRESLVLADPYLGSVRDSLGRETLSPDQQFGTLCREFATRLGLPEGIPVGAGIFDAHSAALSGGVRPGTVAKVIGTSSSDMAVTDLPEGHAFPGVEGVGVGSIFPTWTTIESGQAAYGDLAEWLVRLVSFGSGEAPRRQRDVYHALEVAADKLDFDRIPVAVDWFNGRRAPFGDMAASGALAGLRLGTDAPQLYASLMESAAFATRAGLDHLSSVGVSIDRIHVLGGIPDSSQFAVSVLANVLDRPISIRESSNASARGAAICAAAASGIFSDLLTAQNRLQLRELSVVYPDPKRVHIHKRRYRQYVELGRVTSRIR